MPVVFRWRIGKKAPLYGRCLKGSLESLSPTLKWQFRARFSRRAFGWKSEPAIKRIKGAVYEIKRVARREQLLAAEWG